MPSIANAPVSAATAAISRVAAGVTVKAFSTRTALPARSAASAIARCCGCGVAMYSASTPGSATIAAYESCVAAMPCRAAKAAARSADRDATATSSAPGTCAKSGATLSAIRPGPTTPHRTVLMVAILACRDQLYTAVDDHVDRPEQPFERVPAWRLPVTLRAC
jgi:hypothetical protein